MATKITRCLSICAILLCLSVVAASQIGGVSYMAAPSGSCTSTAVVIDAVGITHTCNNGVWASNLTGIVFLVTSGSCPAYSTEVSSLSGVTLVGTTHANGDVGGTGGSNSITPTGTVSQPSLSINAYTPTGTVAAPTFTGSAGTVPAETFTGTSNQTTSATSAGTPAGTNSGAAFSITTQDYNTGTTAYGPKSLGGTTLASGTTSITLSTQPTFAGTAMGTHTHTLTPAGTNGTVSFTPTGTNSAPVFTGTQATLTGSVSQPTVTLNAFDPHPAFVKVIFCAFN
jgi:hypothetical protein